MLYVAMRHNILSGNIHEVVVQKLLHVVRYYTYYLIKHE